MFFKFICTYEFAWNIRRSYYPLLIWRPILGKRAWPVATVRTLRPKGRWLPNPAEGLCVNLLVPLLSQIIFWVNPSLLPLNEWMKILGLLDSKVADSPKWGFSFLWRKSDFRNSGEVSLIGEGGNYKNSGGNRPQAGSWSYPQGHYVS